MTTLEQLDTKIKEKLAKLGIDEIEPYGIFDLKKNSWQDEWPHSKEPGIYAIFSKEKLLYIGKSSRTIGSRLGDYFKKGDNNTTILNPKHTWTSSPTRFVTWAVPQKIATSPLDDLEVFLISNSKLDPRDNTQHKNKS